MSPAEEKDERLAELEKVQGIDIHTFIQILEMDEEDHDFSWPLVSEFLEQVEETLGKMDDALKGKDLPGLSSLGHYLKGSSATLGFVNLKDECEKIQRYGKKENIDGSPEPDAEICIKRIDEALKAVKVDFNVLKPALKKYYAGVA